MDEKTKARMQAAQTLIQAGDYEAAHALLEGIDHPTAATWRAKLQAQRPAKPPTTRTSGLLTPVILLLALLAMVAGAWLVTQDGRMMSQAKTALRTACVSAGYDLAVCADTAAETVAVWYEEVMHCNHSVGTDRRAAWFDCLDSEGVPLTLYSR